MRARFVDLVELTGSRRTPPQALEFHERRLDRRYHRVDDLVLEVEIEHRRARHVVALRHQVRVGRTVDQLGGDANPVARRADTPLDDITSAEFIAHARHVRGLARAGEARVSRDHGKPAPARETRDQILDEPVRQELLLWIARKGIEGQDRNRRPRTEAIHLKGPGVRIAPMPNPNSCKRVAASVRFVTSSAAMTAATWVLTVAWVTPSTPAISRFVSPFAINSSTSSWRGVSRFTDDSGVAAFRITPNVGRFSAAREHGSGPCSRRPPSCGADSLAESRRPRAARRSASSLLSSREGPLGPISIPNRYLFSASREVSSADARAISLLAGCTPQAECSAKRAIPPGESGFSRRERPRC